MSPDLFILSFAGGQTPAFLPEGMDCPVLDLGDVGGTLCYCDCDSEKKLAGRIPGPGGVCLVGSGDYHYVSKIRTDTISRPFSLLLLDNHPDMQEPAFGDILSCGGWVRTALRDNPFLVKVAIVGMDPALESECGCFESRVRLFPGGVPEPSAVADFLGGGDVFVSVDKDVLDPLWAKTDWNQGSMALPHLLSVVEAVGESSGFIGVDICGEYSSGRDGRVGEYPLENARSNREIIMLARRYLQ